MSPPTLPVSVYTFTFEALQPITDIHFSTSLWRGQFGRALREVVDCIQPHSTCKQCMLLHHCDYALLFYGVLPINAQMMRKYDNVPVPYAFRDPISQPMQVQKGALFSLHMSLIGFACYKLPTIIKSMENIGQSGLEKRRFKVMLNSVSLLEQQGQERLLYANGQLLSLPKETIPPLPPCPKRIRLQWCTPYRDKAVKHKQHVDTLSISKLMMAIIRRISALQSFYTQQPLTTNFTALKTLSLQLEAGCIEQSLLFSPQSRYSAKHKRQLMTSGLLGYLDLSLQGVEALWPYLFLGQFLNVGQNASMGFGRYKVMVLNNEH